MLYLFNIILFFAKTRMSDIAKYIEKTVHSTEQKCFAVSWKYCTAPYLLLLQKAFREQIFCTPAILFSTRHYDSYVGPS